MKCPKCNKMMFPDSMASGNSSLEDEGYGSVASGYHCIPCGVWVWDEIHVVKPDIPPPEHEKRKAKVTTRAYKCVLLEQIAEHITHIRGCRTRGMGWGRLAKRLSSVKNLTVAHSTLKRHVESIEAGGFDVSA